LLLQTKESIKLSTNDLNSVVSGSSGHLGRAENSQCLRKTEGNQFDDVPNGTRPDPTISDILSIYSCLNYYVANGI